MSGDPRVQYARDALRYFDSGNWVTAGALAPSMAARLADAVRQLLDVIAEAGDPEKLTRVRAVLYHFEWEHGDRQLALEEIERIVTGGAR